MSDYNIDNIKNDIQNLQNQNSYDFQEIKRLDRLIKDYEKRVLQAINFNNLINKKIQDDYEEFKKSIMNDNLVGNGGSNSNGLGEEYTQSCRSEYILDKMYPMGQSHEAIPSGLITDTWKHETRWENQNRPTALPHNCTEDGCPGTGLFSALGCWSNIYRVEDTPFTQNTGVEMKDIKVYGWYNGKWELVQYLPVPNGNFYAESFGGDASKYFADSIKQTATSKTIILREKNKIDAMNWNTGKLQTENCMYHPFSDVKYFDTKYEYIYTCIDLRKVKWDDNGIDDRDSTHYCSNCGGDWWLAEGLMFHDSWQHNKGICQPKMVEITNEWRRFSMTTVPEGWTNGFPKIEDNLDFGSGSGSGEGLTSEQAQQLQSAYDHSQIDHVQPSDIPSKTSQLTNDSNFITSNYVDSALGNAGVTPVYSILKNKKWVVIGDSISDVTLNHTPKHYQEIISENTGCALFNWGGNGTGYYTEFNGVSYIYNRINEIPEDADLITIFAGTNDNLKVGNYGDTGFTSFYGAVDKTVAAIKEKFPLVPLGLITPLPRSVNNLTDAKNKNYSDAILKIGKKYSVPVFDMYANCGFSVNNPDFKLNCLTDGLHPNINGHTIIAQKLKPWLEDVVLTSNYYKIIVRGLAVFNSDNLNFTSGGTKTFTLGLNRVPNEKQGVTLSSTNKSITISPSTLYFDKNADSQEIKLTIPSSVNTSFTINAVTWGANIGSITFSNNGSSSGGESDGESEATLSSITAKYTQGSTVVTPSNSLDSLKNNLVVTATYSDGSTQTITDYTLSGTLSVGSSTITVSYSGKTTSFIVNVIEEPEINEELTETDYLVKLDFSDTSQSGKLVDKSGNNNNLNLKNTTSNVLSNGELVVNTKTNCGTNLTTLSTPFEGDSYSIEYGYKQEQNNGSTMIFFQDTTLNVNETGNGSIRCGVKGYGSEGSSAVWGTQDEASFSPGKYNHFVFTVTKTNIKIYVNGVLSKTGNITNAIDKFIINKVQLASYNFQGSINTFNIFKKEITSNQVSDLYNNWCNKGGK